MENENIDTAAHNKDIAALTRALWIFDNAVKVALELMNYGMVRPALSRTIARQTGIYWGNPGPTSAPVAVGAIGTGAHLFRGYRENTDFALHLHALIDGKQEPRCREIAVCGNFRLGPD